MISLKSTLWFSSRNRNDIIKDFTNLAIVWVTFLAKNEQIYLDRVISKMKLKLLFYHKQVYF